MNCQVILKNTNGLMMYFSQKRKDIKGLYFKQIFKDLDEKVPFEYMLISETNSQKYISKMSDILEYGKAYELHDARQLLIFYRDQRGEREQVKIQNTRLKSQQEDKGTNIELTRQLVELKEQFKLFQQQNGEKSEVITKREAEIQKLKERENELKQQLDEYKAMRQQNNDTQLKVIIQREEEITNLKEIQIQIEKQLEENKELMKLQQQKYEQDIKETENIIKQSNQIKENIYSMQLIEKQIESFKTILDEKEGEPIHLASEQLKQKKEFEEVLIKHEELKIKLKEYQAAEIDCLQDLSRIKQENELLRNQKP